MIHDSASTPDLSSRESIRSNKLPHIFQKLSPLVEQCMADSISNNGSENEEVAD